MSVAPRADHGAVTYGNYMVLLYGYTDVTPTFNFKIFLDMSSWKWVRSMSHQDNSEAKDDAGCSYNFPRFPDDMSLTEGNTISSRIVFGWTEHYFFFSLSNSVATLSLPDTDKDLLQKFCNFLDNKG
ncbi:hypothetical protein BDC45DRAFT_530546 [Circinella umbellata]|nr:hypothetical protein BDC45DRAFT_530546 [Circinella umbellata]